MARKIIVMLLLATVALGVSADDYSYLSFCKTDGTAQSLTASGLSMTFADGKAKVVSGDETVEIPLSELTKMLFSYEKITSAVEMVEFAGNGSAAVEAWSLSGVCMGSFGSVSAAQRSLPAGVYVVRINGETKKIAVK